MAEIKLDGVDEMTKKLYRLSEKMIRAAESKALKAGAEVLQKEIIRRAPRDTGTLSERIIISRVKNKDGMRYVEVGPDKSVAWRAKFHEYGTSKMSAKPFMAPAVEAKRGETYVVIAKTLREELSKID